MSLPIESRCVSFTDPFLFHVNSIPRSLVGFLGFSSSTSFSTAFSKAVNAAGVLYPAISSTWVLTMRFPIEVLKLTGSPMY